MPRPLHVTYDVPPGGAGTTRYSYPFPVLGPPASITGRSSQATGLRPFALPRPKHLRTLPDSRLFWRIIPRNEHSPLWCLLGLSGRGCAELPLYGVLRSSTPDTQATLARAWIRFIRFSLVQEAIVHRSEAALPVLPLALS